MIIRLSTEKTLLRGLLCLATGLATWAILAPPARANCGVPVTYSTRFQQGSVFIYPTAWGSEGCSDASVLRENVATGEVVRLAGFCTECEGNIMYAPEGATCHLDECVPPGTYRYGYEHPFGCEPSACGTYYYSEVIVDASAVGCSHREGNAPPQHYASGGRWTDDPLICSYGFGSPDAGPGPAENDKGSGCATAPDVPATVFAFQLLLLALGLLLRRRRRR
jgi:uncharacterized protein (TIGR03382 family)